MTPGKGFSARASIVGPSGQHLKHIEDEAKVQVSVQPENDRTVEATAIDVYGYSHEAVQRGKELVEDLVKSVINDHSNWQATAKNDLMDDDFLDVEPTDQEFGFKHRLVGDNSTHLSFIEEECAPIKVEVRGNEGGKLQIVLSGGKPGRDTEARDRAQNMANELLETVNQQYAQWQADSGKGSGKKRPADGKGKGKGKGKLKGDGPPDKKRRV